MSDMLKKLEYLNETKSSITESLNRKGVVVPDNTPFREYHKLIDEIQNVDLDNYYTKEETDAIIEEVKNVQYPIWVGTQQEYDAIEVKHPFTLYFIKKG